MKYKNEQQRILNHLADSVLGLSDEAILAEVWESGADPQEEAERTRFVLRQASKTLEAVNRRLSNLGHTINSKGWSCVEKTYQNSCLNCGSQVSFSTAMTEMQGDALEGRCVYKDAIYGREASRK